MRLNSCLLDLIFMRKLMIKLHGNLGASLPYLGATADCATRHDFQSILENLTS